MNLAVLRLEGETAALQTLTQQLSLKPEGEWRKGETRPNGVKNLSSGLNSTIAEGASPNQLVTSVREFFEECKSKNISFVNVRAELSFGVTVGCSQQYLAHVEFSPSDLALIASSGCSLSMSAYPTSDEAND